MNQTFDWSLVQSFLAALDQGSLLGAARVLNASQPTIGRHIAELESQLGVVLFERTGRGLLPTATALRLAESARAMEMGAHQLARSVSGAEEGVSGTVRITASQPVACVLLPPVLARMRQVLREGSLGRINYIMARFAKDYRVYGSWGALFRHEIRHSLLIPGASAPKVVTRAMLAHMRPRSVLVDIPSMPDPITLPADRDGIVRRVRPQPPSPDGLPAHPAAQALGLARIDAQLLLLHTLARPDAGRAWLLAHDTDAMEEAAHAQFIALCQRRLAGEPVAYLTGRKEFYGLPLQVDARVLDPRPDTETLVDWALEVIAPLTSPRVVDLGTGSGAIALAIAVERPQCSVVATDASAAALQVLLVQFWQ